MTHRTALQALADATSSVAAQRDVHDTLAQLMSDCRDLLPAAGAGVLVVSRPGVMDLLAATSHQAAELELFQLQAEEGPCHECITRGVRVSARGAEQIRGRWGVVGDAIVAAGFDAVHAFPISWNGVTLGGLNAFGRSPDSDRPDPVLAQTFADLIGMLLMRRLDLDVEEISSRLREVLEGRAVIEQAKGLLAYQRRIPVAEAYEELLDLAEREGRTLSETAAALLGAAQRP
jgi:hypothetical protein